VIHCIDLFTRKEPKQLIIDSLKFGQAERGRIIHALDLMLSLPPVIISTRDKPLPDMMREFSKFTAKIVFWTLVANASI